MPFYYSILPCHLDNQTGGQKVSKIFHFIDKILFVYQKALI